MPASDDLLTEMMGVLRQRLGDQLHLCNFPPPVFVAMQGEFTAFDLQAGSLSVRFPIQGDQLNPYGIMQGGVIAAAIDNALGPLSLLLAPPNVTRRLELIYSKPVLPEMAWITVRALLLERRERRLVFKAEVFDPQQQRLVRARAEHWILA